MQSLLLHGLEGRVRRDALLTDTQRLIVEDQRLPHAG
jgi:hypothetical protein